MVTTIMAKREPKEAVKYPLSFPKSLYERAAAFADSKGLSFAGLVRMALIEYLDKGEKPTA